MAVIASNGALAELERRNAQFSGLGGSVSLYNNRTLTYAEIVESQPNVRTVISFLARNIAQLGIHLYNRVSDTDRERVSDHPFVSALKTPNPLDRRMTRYRLVHATISDLCAYDAGYWGLINVPGASRPGIVRLPPAKMRVVGDSWLWPEAYELVGNRGKMRLTPDQVIHFQGSLNFNDPLVGTSPIETLRRILAEEAAAGEYREQYWRAGARISGVIERPADAPPWKGPARERFRRQWRSAYTGDGSHAGGTPILEDGMTFRETAGTAREAQYIEARKLTREETAAAFHVHPAFVGILEHANFANMREQHRSLYMDTLGPWVVMLEEDLEAQALPAFASPAELETFYVEVNTAEKLRGSIEELADSIRALVGRPVLTANEGRALLNRNDLEDGDGLVLPLNVTIGGQTDPGVDPVDEAGTPDLEAAGRALEAKARPLPEGVKAFGINDRTHDALRTEAEEAHRQLLTRTFQRQRRAVLSAYGAAGPVDGPEELLDRRRWDNELTADLLGLATLTAELFAGATAEALAFDELDTEVLEPWLATNAEIGASNINGTTLDGINQALLAEDPTDELNRLFVIYSSSRAAQIATSRVTMVGNFAAQDTARQAGRGSKVWRVTSSNPRPSHASMDGLEVPLGTNFPIGGAWPGDPALPVAERAGCTCIVQFT